MTSGRCPRLIVLPTLVAILVPVVVLALVLSLPTVALGQAQLRVFSGYLGATPTGAATVPELGGYFLPDDPSLLLSRQFVNPIGPHEGHTDAFLQFDNDYGSDTRVNGERTFGCPTVGGGGACLFVATPGHSGSFASGWADASLLGLGAHSETFDHGAASAGESMANAGYRNRFTVQPGTSGLAPGTPVTLRWRFRLQGSQEASGRTYPSTTSVTTDAFLGARITRRVCDEVEGCFPGTAASFQLSARADANDVNPAFSGGATGEIGNDLRWNAFTNLGQQVGDRQTSVQTFDVPDASMPEGAVIPGEFARVGGFQIDSAQSPIALPFLDFEATVGETLELRADLSTYAIFGGGVGSLPGSFGAARNAFFGGFESGLEDPNNLGLEIVLEISGTSPPDGTSPNPSVSINDVTVIEGNTGTTEAVFTVTLSQASGQTVSIDFATADGTATAGSDYVADSGTLLFNPGETTKTITILVNGDTLVEPDETFSVNLTNATNATIAKGEGVGTITNDDAAEVIIAINEVVSVTDSAQVTPPVIIEVVENINVMDTPEILPPVMVNVVESITVSDGLGLLPSAVINLVENVNVTDAPGIFPAVVIAVNEMILVVDAPAVLPSAMINVLENVNVTDVPGIFPPVVIAVNEMIRVTDAPKIGNTPAGSNVIAKPVDPNTGKSPVTMRFANVLQGGDTFLSITQSALAQPPPGFRAGNPELYFDLTTTAVFFGPVELCIDYSDILFANESRIRLFHLANGQWENITDSIGTEANIVCGVTHSLSLFAIFEYDDRALIAVTNGSGNQITLVDGGTFAVIGAFDIGWRPTGTAFYDVFHELFAPPTKLYVISRAGEDGSSDDEDKSKEGRGAVRVFAGSASPTPEYFLDFSLATAIEVGKRPESLALSPDGSQVWVANRYDDSISIIDRATDTLVRTLPLRKLVPAKGKGKGQEEIRIGKSPVALAFSQDGKFAYVVGRNSDNLIVIDKEKALTDPSAAILGFVGTGKEPGALAVDPAGRRVYVVNRDGGTVAVVDVNASGSPTLKAQIRVGRKPQGIAILADGTKVYVTDSESNTVFVLEVRPDPIFLSYVGTIPVGRKPSALALSRPGSFAGVELLYVANGEEHTISVIDTAAEQEIAVIPVPGGVRSLATGLLPTAP